ncbi:hypothetical protein VTN77DRAFT_6396 [Rasamsonia byssochlamydoides]|uniref:uncharacterized protein n=1 Tax=Rasamsonia byssochlamydoides TaxID=89139 RepID=UPI0037441884
MLGSARSKKNPPAHSRGAVGVRGQAGLGQRSCGNVKGPSNRDTTATALSEEACNSGHCCETILAASAIGPR